jgi:phosphate-selective porin OprO and OprP
MSTLRIVTVAVMLTGMMAVTARAGYAQAVTSGYQDGGFFVQSADGEHRLAIGAVLQTDGRFSVDSPTPITNTFVLRKARPILNGRLYRYFDFLFMTEFGNGSATVLDAYFDIRFSPAFRVRTGKGKTPIGYEVLLGDPTLPFPERMLSSSLIPNRDVGIQAQGDLLGGKLTYSGGLFNGVPDGTSSTADVDANNAKDFAGRVVVMPFRTTRTPAPALSGLGFHLGASAGTQAGAVPSFRTSVGQPYFSYATGTTAAGTRVRVTPTVFYYFKRVGAFAEYARSEQRLSRAGLADDVANQGWGVTASYSLTGEPVTDRGLRPRANFDPAKGQWGALQVLARYSELHVDDAVVANGFAAGGSNRRASMFTAALNWYPAPVMKWYATYERTTFGDDVTTARPTENVILFRGQLNF